MQVERPRIRARVFGARNFKPEGVFRSERGQKIQPRYRSMFRSARPVDWGLNGPAVSPRLIPSTYFRRSAQPNRHFSRAGRQVLALFRLAREGPTGISFGEGRSCRFSAWRGTVLPVFRLTRAVYPESRLARVDLLVFRLASLSKRDSGRFALTRRISSRRGPAKRDSGRRTLARRYSSRLETLSLSGL